MDRDIQLRQEMAEILQRIVSGSAPMRDFSAFAAPLALDDAIGEDLRVDLDVLLAVADQVEYAFMDEEIFVEDARHVLSRIEADSGGPERIGELGPERSALVAAD